MKDYTEGMLISLLLFLLCHVSPVQSDMDFAMVTLDSYQVCQGLKVDIYWASKNKAILVVGRGADDRRPFQDCSIVIGAATAESSLLQLNFEAFHIKDCGVSLSINQSSKSDFTTGNSVLAKIGCNHGRMRVLHSLEKHFVKISVHKDNLRLQRYNFRINVTVIDKRQQSSDVEQHNCSTDSSESDLDLGAFTDIPSSVETHFVDNSVNKSWDKLPETGPETHVVIIVGVVVVFVVGMALYLLVKYLMYRAQRWQEQCAERNMERAIRLFNSQESPPEPDYMYTALPLPEVDRPRGGGGHGGQSKNAGNRGGRYHAGDITFVHADGHMESFHMRDSPQERRRGESELPAVATTPRSTRSALSARDRDAESVLDNGEVASGECPPSYEEALHMPTPQDPQSALYVNVDNKEDDNHRT